ncbi:LysM peptidoglycan-binding domain-containing protein [Cohnella lupini]|uniref:LysM peptidoglycan-binding domain-containing protein n=1 Tax=Cohnella lupini TaxID=1294267 RepID=UPI000E23FF8A|nr:LysM peptidoglycan-binding domain-containing protein [Cohnella lupini]
MGKKAWFSKKAGIFALAIAVVSSGYSQPAVWAAKGAAPAVLDDYESYGNDEGLQAAWKLDWSDKAGSVAIGIGQGSGSKTLKLTVVDKTATWANVMHPIAEEQSDASSFEGITFWLNNETADGKPLDLGMELKTNVPNGAFNLKQSGTAQLSAADGEWKPSSFNAGSLHINAGFKGNVRIAWSEFNQAAWQCGGDQTPCAAVIDSGSLTGLQFGYNPSAHEGNTIEIDDAGFYGATSSNGNGGTPPAEPAKPKPAEAPKAPVWATASGTQELAYKPAPIDNPLKGFMPFLDAGKEGFFKEGDDWRDRPSQMPYSLEFFYEPLSAVMLGIDKFDWSHFDKQLNDIASRGHQAVFRFYIDYPNKPSGIPQFLLDGGLKTRAYTEFENGKETASVSPDWDDPNLVSAIEKFSAALGERYDGDPRVGFIMVGLIGFWGEWHTYPYDGWTPKTDADGKELKDDKGETVRLANWMPSEANQKKVLDAMDDAFDQTRLVVRNPIANETFQTKNYDIGYHDDSFAFQTLPTSMGGQDWHFWGRAITAEDTDFWKTRPMGGEMRPEIQVPMWNNDPPKYNDPVKPIEGAQGEDFYDAVNLTHASFMMNQGVFQIPLQPVALGRAQEGSRSLGYEYSAVKSYLNDSNGSLNIGVEVENKGVAPFYYDWQVELSAKVGNKVVKTWSTDWKLSGILPNDANGNHNVLWQGSFKPQLTSGDYDIYLRVVNPLEKTTSKAVKFRFANKDQSADGWLKLGKVTVSGASRSGEYVVRAGDNLSKIASRIGTTWQRIQALNRLPNPNLIYPGQTLKLPE